MDAGAAGDESAKSAADSAATAAQAMTAPGPPRSETAGITATQPSAAPAMASEMANPEASRASVSRGSYRAAKPRGN